MKPSTSLSRLRKSNRSTPTIIWEFCTCINETTSLQPRPSSIKLVLFALTLEYDPGHIDSYIELATIAAISGDLKKSKTIFERALKIEPRNYKCNTRYGYLLKLKLKDYIKATQVF